MSRTGRLQMKGLGLPQVLEIMENLEITKINPMNGKIMEFKKKTPE